MDPGIVDIVLGSVWPFVTLVAIVIFFILGLKIHRCYKIQKERSQPKREETMTQESVLLEKKDRVQVLLNEMNLVQGRLDKYDDVIFKNRGWTITIAIALLGSALTLKKKELAILAVFVLLLFYLIEILWRWLYMHKYIERYRFIRDSLHDKKPIDSFMVYDLTHHYGEPPEWWSKVRDCVLKLEPFIFYVSLVIASFVIRSLQQ